MENEAQTTEDFAAQLAQADQPEQPPEDSGQAEPVEGEEGPTDNAPDPAAEAVEREPADQPSEESADEDRVVAWKTAAGEEFSVPESELRSGYMREQDYRHKTQQIAETVRKGQEAVHQQIQVVQTVGAELAQLQGIQQQLQAYQGVDWQALDAQDPQLAAQHRTKHLELREHFRDLQGAIGQKQQFLAQQSEQQRSGAAVEAFHHLQKEVKGFDLKQLEAMSRACVAAGHKPEDLKRVTNPVLVHDLWKARQWDALQAKKPEVTNRARALPPVAAGKQARATVPTTKQQEVAKAISTKRTFNPRDFASLLKNT